MSFIVKSFLFFALSVNLYADDQVAKARLILDNKDIDVLNQDLCDKDFTINFNLKNNSTVDKFWALRKISSSTASSASSTCPEKIKRTTPVDAEFDKGDPTISGESLLGEKLCKKDDKNGQKGTALLCIYPAGGYDEQNLLAQVRYTFDTTTLSIEKIYDKMALNEKLVCNVKINRQLLADIKLEVCYGKKDGKNIDKIVGDDCPTDFTSKSIDGLSVEIKGLENDEPYLFKIRVISPRKSKWADPFEETPIPASSPSLSHKGAGGDLEIPSCSTNSPNSIFMLIIVMLCFWFRKKVMKSFGANSSFFVLIIFCMTISDKSFTQVENDKYSFSILGSMYRPDLDNQFLPNGKKIFPIYKCFFRKNLSDTEGPINPLIGADFGWKFFDGFLGSMYAGIGGAYTYVSGYHLKIDSTTSLPDCTKPIKDAPTSLHIYPLNINITSRMDYFKDSTLPILLYAKASALAIGYTFRDLGLAPDNAKTKSPSGFRFGYEAEAGVELKINFIGSSYVAHARASDSYNDIFLTTGLAYSDMFIKSGYNFRAKDIMGTNLPLRWVFGLRFSI